jgi:hypothetical protein
MVAAIDHARDHVGLLEQLQMSRDRRLGDAEVPSELADRAWAAAQPLDDLPPDRMREGGKRIVSYFANYISR